MRARSGLLTAGLLLAIAARWAGAQVPSDLEPGVQTSPAPAAAAPPSQAAPLPTATAQPGPAAQKASVAGRRAPAAAAGSAGGKTGSKDEIQLDTTQISGNRELPKVMYVVPWRKADPGEFAGRPPNSLLDEALTPVDRDVFLRQNRYYAALQGGASGSSAGASQAEEKAPRPASPETKDEK